MRADRKNERETGLISSGPWGGDGEPDLGLIHHVTKEGTGSQVAPPMSFDPLETGNAPHCSR